MRRRAFLATAGTAALAGCTASGDGGDGEVDPDDYEIRGVENSDVYHDATMMEPSLLESATSFWANEIEVVLEFDPDADYDPADHDVYLMDGERVVAEGSGEADFSDGMHMIVFEIDPAELEETQTFRVVSMHVTGPTDEFELTIVREGSESE